MIRLLLINLFICFPPLAGVLHAIESCSRIAIINHQEVLVDSSSSVRGDGLRFYLEKDDTAKQYLDQYQKNSRPSLHSAGLSTLGSVMTIAGLLTQNDTSSFFNRNVLIGSGLSLILLNYFVSQTYQYNNEQNLLKAVEEYNKRNFPKIYFSVGKDFNGKSDSYGINFGYSKDF
jgi:antibiotic biosynthesis monooxygenase (ABM) superfamily enzyme